MPSMSDPSLNPEQPSPAQPITDASEPFHLSATADIILRSSDSMDFFVLKALLSFASPIFDDMMSPSQEDAAKGKDMRNGLHIVPLPEDGKTVYNLLLLIYPFVERSTNQIDTYLKVARAAKKYGMDKVEERLRKQLVTSPGVMDTAFRAFAIAAHFGWKEEAKAAAVKTLTEVLDHQILQESLKMISGADYYKLLQWRSECHRAVTGLLKSDQALSDQHESNFVLERKLLAAVLLNRLEVTDCPDGATMMNCTAIVQVLKTVDGYETINKSKSRVTSSNIGRARTAMLRVCESMKVKIDETVLKIPFEADALDADMNDPPSNSEPVNGATDAQEPFHSSANADIILRSSDSVDFFALKGILSFASPIFENMISLNQGDAAKENDVRNKLHIVPLPEDSKTVYDLLLLIYPFVERPIADIDTYLKVVGAAKKYGMDKVEDRLRKKLVTSEVMAQDPFQAFAIAVHFGWKGEAKAAAVKTLPSPLKDQVRREGLKIISGSDYHNLFEWRSKCHRAVADFLKSDKAQSDQHRGNFVLKRKFLAGVLLDRLAATHCPHSTTIMDHSTVVTALENVDGHEKIATRESFRTASISSLNVDQAQEAMFMVCKSMTAHIDRIVSEVPFDTND